jgi:integrase
MEDKRFTNYLEFFTDKLEFDRASKNTIEGYAWAVRKLRKEFANYDVDKIGRFEVDNLKKTYGHLAAASVNLLLVTLKKVLNLALSYDDIAEVPKMEFLTPKVNDSFLSDDEAQSLLDHCGHPLRLMVAIALTTGLRKENIFRLRWSQIQGGTVTVKAKNNKTLSIPLAPRVMEMIERHRKYLMKRKKCLSAWVFPSPLDYNKFKAHSADGGLNNCFIRAGMQYSGWHILRHTFATSFLRETGNLRLLQDILGHANLAQTARYAHIAMDQKKEALEMHSQGLEVKKKPIPRKRKKMNGIQTDEIHEAPPSCSP